MYRRVVFIRDYCIKKSNLDLKKQMMFAALFPTTDFCKIITCHPGRLFSSDFLTPKPSCDKWIGWPFINCGMFSLSFFLIPVGNAFSIFFVKNFRNLEDATLYVASELSFFLSVCFCFVNTEGFEFDLRWNVTFLGNKKKIAIKLLRWRCLNFLWAH